ncbi:hypothetical protein [Glycomyces harbinensis]|uniref:Uncharacterized protein n=1 Tax=Glycomyces harbinensis TaxID=58114 RepID=A0A1G6RNK0_9ACTN|nr:hypothetical protein [Glycomyces harbinensis]SDD06001.1 hypothetical protein SAMN05216270_101573 [Glycomyces harbinensis]
MDGPDETAMPSGYPDPAVLGWVRSEDIESAGIHIRFTVNPGDKIVQMWELVDGRPARWLGNVYRVDAPIPSLYLNYHYEKRFKRLQREALALAGAKFWKS